MNANSATRYLIVTLAAVGLSAAMFGPTSGQQAIPAESESVANDRAGNVVWEYKVPSLIYNSNGLEADLNKLGAEGWELVHIEDGLPAVFKRQKGTQ